MLRSGTPSSAVVFDGDDEHTTFHLGARLGDDLIAISTWLRRRPTWDDTPTGAAFQLRGMASHPDHRGAGAASALLVDGVARCRRLEASLVWARARVRAVDFYEHHGFRVVGDEYVDETTGLKHRDIARHLA